MNAFIWMASLHRRHRNTLWSITNVEQCRNTFKWKLYKRWYSFLNALRCWYPNIILKQVFVNTVIHSWFDKYISVTHSFPLQFLTNYVKYKKDLRKIYVPALHKIGSCCFILGRWRKKPEMAISNIQAYQLSDANSRITIYKYNTVLNQIMRRYLITKRT